MAHKKSQSVLAWTLWHPIKFALIAFVFIVLITALLGIFNTGDVGWPISAGVLTAILLAALITFRTMPRTNMDRTGFVALNNLQIPIVTTLFLISALAIDTYQHQITTQLTWLSITNNALLIAIIILAGLFYMYLCGVFFTNVYAKYLRCRDMGLAPWKIICSMPFGFGLLWIPGYFLADKNKPTPAVTINTTWYSKFTNWLAASPAYTTLVFVLITIYSGFFYGFNMATLTMISAVIFALWYRIAGLSSFRGHMKKQYPYVAIVANILTIIGLMIFFTSSVNSAANIAMNISDIAPTNVQ